MAKGKKTSWIWIGKGVVKDEAFKKEGKYIVPQRGEDVTARVAKLSEDVVKSLVDDKKIADLENEVTQAVAEKAKRERTLAALQEAEKARAEREEEKKDETP